MRAAENRVKKLIDADRVALGVVCRSLSPVVVELMGLADFDFVWVDMEHSSATFADVENLCRAAEASGTEMLVRVSDKTPSKVLRALDAGAGIVNVPLVESRSEAEAVVQAARYPPQGSRGFCPTSRGNIYGAGGTSKEVFAAANARVLTMIQIESKSGAEKAAEISQVSGLDAIFIGLGDLAQTLGPGAADRSTMEEYVDLIVESATANGKTIAALANSPEDARGWIARGARIVCCGVDIPILRDHFAHIARNFAAVCR